MRHVRRPAPLIRPVVLATFAVACAAAAPARSADLSPYAVIPAPLPAPVPYAGPSGSFGLDPGPASDSGYYGYYGFDILGTPYRGLYSANVLCLRSVATPYGYRTVNVCRPD